MRFLIKWKVEVIGKISSLCIISVKSLDLIVFEVKVADDQEYILKIFPIVQTDQWKRTVWLVELSEILENSSTILLHMQK